MTTLIHQNTEHLTVSQLNQQARLLLEGHFGHVWVEGEISNYVAHRSGHWYFSLKDDKAQVRCAMFKGANQYVRFRVEEGQLVKCLASVSLYEGRGDFQLIVRSLEPVGDGALQRAFEQLKQKLHKEGLFAEQHKQKIPKLAENIAILSSPTGAAIRDMLTTLKRRSFGQSITLYPCEVQGKNAAQSVLQQLKTAIKAKPDVILVARGGGSLEDLWPFNDEALARAIFDCPIPVVSGVGHEIDFTICDFVSDLRAATPTAAAELVSPDPVELKKYIQKQEQLLSRTILNQLKHGALMLDSVRKRLLSCGERFGQQKQTIDHLTATLTHAQERLMGHKHRQLNQAVRRLTQLQPNISQQQKHVNALYSRLQRVIATRLKQSEAHYNRLRQRLHPSLIKVEQHKPAIHNAHDKLNLFIKAYIKDLKKHLKYLDKRLQQAAPQTILNKGYSIIRDDEGNIIQHAKKLKKGQHIAVTLAKGRIDATVDKITN